MRFSNFFTLIFLYTLIFGGCFKESQSKLTEFYFNETFEIGIEEKIFDQNKNIRFQVVSVIEDSRCQKGIPCFTEDRLRLEIELAIDGILSTHYITYQKGKNLQKMIAGLGFTLTNVFPNNQIDEKINLEDYSFSMIIKAI